MISEYFLLSLLITLDMLIHWFSGAPTVFFMLWPSLSPTFLIRVYYTSVSGIEYSLYQSILPSVRTTRNIIHPVHALERHCLVNGREQRYEG